jgi:hypothetical protein
MQAVFRCELQSLVSAANYERQKAEMEKAKAVARGLVERVIAPEVMRMAAMGRTELVWDCTMTDEYTAQFVLADLSLKFTDCTITHTTTAKTITISWT